MTDHAPNDMMSREWFLTAGETDAFGRMPISLVTARAIQMAIYHANSLNIGYSNLAEHRLGWVLARISIDMHRYPAINETYSMDTWIEGYNRYFSDRCFEMSDASGATIADIRSQWVAIDTETRTLANLSELSRECFPTLRRDCPVPRQPRLSIPAEADVETSEYTFRFCDIDFNMHVNTLRYLECVLNIRPLDFYRDNEIAMLEMSFEHECHFGETVTLRTGTSGHVQTTEILQPDGRRAVAIRITYRPRKQQTTSKHIN